MKTILITGGAGFIGSHLAERCLAQNNKVIVIDNLSAGRVENIAHLIENPNLKFIKEDICNFNAIEPVFEKVDYVFHLAALADIVPSINNPSEYHRSNVNGTLSVLEAAKKHNIKKLVYAASASCYGNNAPIPTPEDAPFSPQYPYALTKMIAEQYVLHWGQVYNLPVISLRLFNAYGPRSRTNGTYGAVFGVFLAQKLAGAPFTVIGNGEQKRDFTFVTDIVDAFVKAADSKVTQEIFNVGASNPQSINKLTSLLEGETVRLPDRPGEPECTMADISKIRSQLNWSPQTSFENGVQIMLENISYWSEATVWDKNSIKEATHEWFKYLGDEQ